ncbi:hypothetical protein COOONC_16843 [Cooperia oncophora]
MTLLSLCLWILKSSALRSPEEEDLSRMQFSQMPGDVVAEVYTQKFRERERKRQLWCCFASWMERSNVEGDDELQRGVERIQRVRETVQFVSYISQTRWEFFSKITTY